MEVNLTLYIMRRYFLIFLLSGFFFSCQNESEVTQQAPRPAVLNEILDLAENNSINRFNINWTIARDSVDQTFEEEGLAEAIRTLLRILADDHAFYRTGNTTYYEPSFTCSHSALSITDLPAEIGYVAVDGFSGTNEEGVAFATSIQDQLRQGIANGAMAWVVDLTNNTGGDTFPMVAGLGPLLGNNILGYYLFPDGQASIWGYQNGVAYENSVTLNPRTTVTKSFGNFPIGSESRGIDGQLDH